MDGDFAPSPKDMTADTVGNVNLLVFYHVDGMGRFEMEAGIVLGHEYFMPSGLLKVACGTNATWNDRVRKNLRRGRWSEGRWPLRFKKCLVERSLRKIRNGSE